ncbi:MAG: hypothetical protein ACQ9MH_18015 [Nitrospinales bacterium]
MKRICCLSTPLIFLVVCILGIQTVTAKTLYDNFSGDLLNSSKWNQGEFVREVSQGRLVMILHNSPNEINIRKTTPFANPSSINIIEFDIMLSSAMLDSGADPESFARVDGRFYNAQNSGTERGDIWAGLYFGDRGNGLEVWWYVSESTDDDGNTWDDKGSGSLNIDELLYNQPYTAKIDYDGANEFTFTFADMSESFTGPVRQGAEYAKYKALETIVYTDGGAGNGYVYASFDDVLTNGSAYDDFSTSPLDQTKWGKQESAREIENGKLRLVSHSTGEKDTTRLNFSDISPYTEVTVKINGNSMIDAGDRGIARIDGYFYNDTYGPGSGSDYNGYEGNVWVGFYLNYYGDGTLKAACSGDRSVDAADTLQDNLFYRELNLPIVLNRNYKLSIQFTGSNLFFICKDTVTGRMDMFGYNIGTSVYEPYEKSLSLTSRVYGNSTGRYLAVEFDDIYIDAAEPQATFDANGDWKLTTSNAWAVGVCDLPDDGETTDVTITQVGNDLTLVVHDIDDGDTTLTGYVYGNNYIFEVIAEDDGETEIVYGIITLSKSTSGNGSITFIWTDGFEWCEAGFDVSIAKPSNGGGGGGGGGGGCFVEIITH